MIINKVSSPNSFKPLKSETGKTKKTKYYQRTLKQYRHQVLCRRCKKYKVRVSWKAAPPVYCSEDCCKRYHSELSADLAKGGTRIDG